jgi:hypothetical protein
MNQTFFAALLLTVAITNTLGCSSSTANVGSAGADAGTTTAPDGDTGTLGPTCEPIQKKTRCKNGAEGAIVRANIHFDPSARTPGKAAPALTVFLRHSFALMPIEATVGGRLHAYKRIKLTADQLASGDVSIELDLCQNGTAMWSEENGLFNLVAILDENGAHDPQTASDEYAFQTPIKDEWSKMTTGIDVSCNKESSCVAVNLDCADGASCTTFTPITHVECKTPACPSDDSFCKSGTSGH